MRRIIMFRKMFDERGSVMFKKSVYRIAAISVLSWTTLAGAGNFVEDFESYQVHALLNDLPNWTTVVYGVANTEISGGDYYIDDINGSQRLHSPRGGNTIAVINPDVLTLGKGTDLEMSVDIYYNGVGIGNGLIFYYRDQDNFYYVEMVAPNNANSFRFRKRVGGSTETIIEQVPAGLELNTEYRLHVQFKADSNTFDIWLETLSDGNIVQKFENVEDDTFRGGQVGVWAHSSTNGMFDNLTVVRPSGIAENPSPADQATDVQRNVVLNWTSGEFADMHDVYFGASFDDVNNATVSVDLTGVYRGRQSDSSYAVGEHLDLDQTYYWRIDEVNAAPDYTVFEGNVWQFTAEPIAYTIENATVTASSANRDDEGPENTTNGSGLDNNDLHSSESTAMWLSSGTDPNPTWIQYEFERVHKLHQMLVWNYNTSVEPLVGFGVKEATIEYSVDGTDWSVLGTTHEFARGPGAPGYTSNTTIDVEGTVAGYVRITADSNWGGMLKQYGLSEVRFSSTPVVAREPSPGSGAADVSADAILSFRAGREAATHDVYLSTDEQAAIDGTAPVATVTESSHAPSLDLATTYYWRVDEVNDAESPTNWQSDIWYFTTEEFIVVDDFESYNDIPAGEEGSNLVYVTWVDGFDNPSANGSTMGYVAGASLESDTVHSGGKSVPLAYNNTTAGVSEVMRTFATAQDWTAHGVITLSLWFAGAGANVPGQLYVKVNGVRVDYDGDAGNLALAGWQPWNIDLTAVNTNLSNVTSLAVGIQGPGATGTLLLDDIRLYALARERITPVQPDPAGLVLHYEFEGNANDSTGANNGTALGSPTYGPGRIGQAINLDGIDDHVAIENFHYASGGHAEVSVCAWIRTSSESDQIIASFDRNEYWRLEINGDGGGPGQIGWGVTTDTGLVGSGSSARVDDGQWHHVAGTFDNGVLTLYIDGNAEESVSGGSTYGSGNTRFGYIGVGSESTAFNTDPKTPVYLITGAVDDVRIYDRALTHGEVASLAGRTKPFDIEG